MAITCLIIEDNKEERTRVKEILCNKLPEITSIKEAENVTEAKNILSIYQPDIILADIHLGDSMIFDTLKQIPKLNSKLIFTTSHSEYAVLAFQFSAINYLLKPYSKEDLIREVRKTIVIIQQENYHQQLEVLFHNLKKQGNPERIVLKNHDLIHVVEINDILYAQADNNYTHFFCEDRKILVSKSLKTFEEQLASHKFFRCHHSYLINLGKIRALHKAGDAVILNDGSTVPIASSKKKLLYSLIG